MTADDIRMRRKIQQLGSSTLAVTLPAAWARKQGVSKGDELVVQQDESGGSLLLVPEQPATADTVATIDTEGLKPAALERAILAQYVLGRQLIRLEGEGLLPPAQLEAIDAIETQLMGLGVVERSQTRVDIRCSVAPGDFELPKLLERLWRTESVIREEATQAFLAGDREDAKRALHYEAQAEKLFYLFLRLLFATYRNPRLNRTMGLETGFPLIGYRSIAQDVVLMTACSCRIARLVEDWGPLTGDTKAAFLGVMEALEQAVDGVRAAVSDPTPEATETAREVLADFNDQVRETQRFLETERPEPLLILQRTLSTLRQTGEHAGDSLEVATHLAARAVSVVETEI